MKLKQTSNLEKKWRETRSNTDVNVITLKRTKSPKTALAQSGYNSGAHRNVKFSYIQLHSAGQGELRSFKLLKPESMPCNSVLTVIPGAGNVHGNDSAMQYGSDAVIDSCKGLQVICHHLS